MKIDDLVYHYITIYHNLNHDSYYYHLVKFVREEVGYINRQNHELILIIPINKLAYREKHKFKKKVLNRLIYFLQNKVDNSSGSRKNPSSS